MGRTEEGWNRLAGPPLARQNSWVGPSPPNLTQLNARGEEGGAILEYWQLIKRRKIFVFVTAFLGALVAFIVLVMQQPVYVAFTSVELQGFNESFMNLSSADPLAGNYGVNKENISTEIRIIQSASVRVPVIERLRRETAPVLPPKGGVLAPVRTFLRGKEDPLLEMSKGLAMAAGSLKVQPVLGTRIIYISAESTIPDLAAGYVNAVTTEYQTQSAQQRTLSTQKTSQWLETQIEDTRAKTEQAENRLRDFARQSGIGLVGGDTKDTLASSQLRLLQADLGAVRAERIAKQAKYEQIKASPPDSLPDITNDVAYQQFQVKLSDLRKDLAKLTLTLTPANPRVQRVQDQIVELTAAMQKEKEAILQRARNDYEDVQKHEQLLANAYAGQAGTVSGQSDKVAQYDQLKREVDLYQGTFNAMMQQLNTTAVASALPTTNARVIDPAVAPALPSKPDAKTYEAYGLAGGCAAGILLIVLIDKLFTWRSSLMFGMPGYSPRFLKVPELGVIPSIVAESGPADVTAESRWRKLLPSARGQAAQSVLLNAAGSGSVHAESFRLTLTSILLMSRGGHEPKIIVVTSPGPGEGKTTVVSNMAVAIAESGRKVLVIDADLRRPRMHTIFRTANDEGFADLMTRAKAAGSAALNVAPTVCETQIPGVFVLPSGATSDLNLSQIFHSPAVTVLLNKLKEQFDLILIDTPPMIQFSDARLMARLSDGLILVVRSGITARESAVSAREQLGQDNINVLGTILNDWDARANQKNQYHSRYSVYSQYQQTDTQKNS